jgi:hypothetical protein
MKAAKLAKKISLLNYTKRVIADLKNTEDDIYQRCVVELKLTNDDGAFDYVFNSFGTAEEALLNRKERKEKSLNCGEKKT